MKKLTEKIKAYNAEVTFKSLKEFLDTVDIASIDYEDCINEPEREGDYGRNIFTMQPFECVLINWPAGVESAVHLHAGLFGYVWVLEGELDNVSYRFKDGVLSEFAINRYCCQGLIPEPDGVIHKLRNNSSTKRAITLHFYYPAIESFDGMEIYNVESGEVGILSDQAKTASWTTSEGHFKELRKNAFTYQSFDELNSHKSHLLSFVIPKPETPRINEMNAAYFCEQAAKYDFSDFNQPSRKSYIDQIDNLVALGIKSQSSVDKHLDIATGTGRRALHIRELAGRPYELVGVDISEEMCKIAESRGIRTYHQDWANEDGHIGEYFESISFLYAFGHLATEEARIKTLQKIASYLVSKGMFYFDVFSIQNQNEWGPLAKKAFETKDLGKYGYQPGDVFYRKRNFEEVAFLHYFSQDEIKGLLEQCGLKIISTQYIGYSKNPGELVGSDKEGSIFIAAQKV